MHGCKALKLNFLEEITSSLEAQFGRTTLPLPCHQNLKQRTMPTLLGHQNGTCSSFSNHRMRSHTRARVESAHSWVLFHSGARHGTARPRVWSGFDLIERDANAKEETKEKEEEGEVILAAAAAPWHGWRPLLAPPSRRQRIDRSLPLSSLEG